MFKLVKILWYLRCIIVLQEIICCLLTDSSRYCSQLQSNPGQLKGYCDLLSSDTYNQNKATALMFLAVADQNHPGSLFFKIH